MILVIEKSSHQKEWRIEDQTKETHQAMLSNATKDPEQKYRITY